MRLWRTINHKGGCGFYFIYAINKAQVVFESRVSGSEPGARVEKKLLKRRYPTATIKVFTFKGMMEMVE